MRYESIADIYSANAKVRERLAATLSNVTSSEAASLADGETWTVQQIAEHISIVNGGVNRICAKLLAAAKSDGKPSDGSFSLTENFALHAAGVGTQKLEAPERVVPTGEVEIADTLEKLAAMDADSNALRVDLEGFDLSAHTFLHPYFGPLNAGEWLVMAGLHENRHREQIERALAKLRQ